MNRTALAMWQGGFRTGSGSVTVLDGGICEVPFTYRSRFEHETTLSPEGMLAGAHAAAFAMSFARCLEASGIRAERIDTAATVKVEEIQGLDTITRVDLELLVHADAADRARITQAAQQAELNCSVSRLIKAQIRLHLEIKDRTCFSAA